MNEWADKTIVELVAQHGVVPPPWFEFPNEHPVSMCWRMGAGELHVMAFQTWWNRENFNIEQRIAYFQKWPPSPRWLTWMFDTIWDLEPWDLEESEWFEFYKPYLVKVKGLGFPTWAEYEQDYQDGKWLEAD
jgi:hypothetical protein